MSKCSTSELCPTPTTEGMQSEKNYNPKNLPSDTYSYIWEIRVQTTPPPPPHPALLLTHDPACGIYIKGPALDITFEDALIGNRGSWSA